MTAPLQPHFTPLVGAATSIASVIVSLLPELELGLRIAVLLVGLVAGLLSLRKAWRERNR